MQIDNVLISERDYNNILTAIGYPVIDTETLSYLITEDQIKDLVIAPALETFFQFFPKRTPISISAAGTTGVQEIKENIPSNAFGIVSLQFVSQSASSLGVSVMDAGLFYQNPFFTSSQIYSMGSGGGVGGTAVYGVPFSYGFETQRFQKLFYAKSLEASTKAYWYRFDPATKTLFLKSNLAGNFYVDFACLENNVDNIDFTKKQSFLRYCKGALKLQIADTLSLVETELPVQLNKDLLKEDGNSLIEKELQYWQEASTIPAMR